MICIVALVNSQSVHIVVAENWRSHTTILLCHVCRWLCLVCITNCIYMVRVHFLIDFIPLQIVSALDAVFFPLQPKMVNQEAVY